MSRAEATPIFDPTLVRRAAVDALWKLDPRRQIRNPVMFVVLIGSVLTTALFCQALLGRGEATPGFIGWVAAWLWFTVLFANFAEALAEGRGKAQADALRRARRDIEAHLIEGEIGLRKPGIGRHHGSRHDRLRFTQMIAVPVVRVFSTNAGKVGPRALRSPLVRMIVNRFAEPRVIAVAQDVGHQRADHLRMAVVTTFAQVDVAALERQRAVRFDAGRRRRRLARQVQRHDLHQSANADHEHDPQPEPRDLLLYDFVFHTGSGIALSSTGSVPAAVLAAL